MLPGDFVTKNQFSFPGEKCAGPEVIVLHDVRHVLGDYGTTAEEEVQVAAFQAGTHHANEFHALLFASRSSTSASRSLPSRRPSG